MKLHRLFKNFKKEETDDLVAPSNDANGKLIRMLNGFKKKEAKRSIVSTKEKANLAAVKQKIGWVSPSYDKARSVRLDPHVLQKNRCVAMFPDMPESEHYKVLRTQILNQIQQNGGGNSIMVTSVWPCEGKTLTAINLAVTFAKVFEQTALLVDCDLRQQNIHEVLGFASDKGLVNYLLGECNVSDLIIWPGIEKLTLISGGKTIDESSEILDSPQMKELVNDMRSRYPDRMIFFDVPPILIGADALTFASLVDHILLVVKAGDTPMNDLKRALSMMPRDKILGLVLNHQGV